MEARKVFVHLKVPSHVLSFDIFGMPYSEPVMVGMSPRKSQGDMAVCGAASLISAEDWTTREFWSVRAQRRLVRKESLKPLPYRKIMVIVLLETQEK